MASAYLDLQAITRCEAARSGDGRQAHHRLLQCLALARRAIIGISFPPIPWPMTAPWFSDPQLWRFAAFCSVLRHFVAFCGILWHFAAFPAFSGTHSGIVGCEGSVWQFAPLQFLTAWSFLGVPLPELLLCVPFLGVHPAALVAVAALALLDRAFSFVHFTQVGGVTRWY